MARLQGKHLFVVLHETQAEITTDTACSAEIYAVFPLEVRAVWWDCAWWELGHIPANCVGTGTAWRGQSLGSSGQRE